MSRTIKKYELGPDHLVARTGDGMRFVFDVPRGARPLDVQIQDYIGAPVIWFLLDDEVHAVPHAVSIVSTGSIVPYGVGEYVGTFQFQALVWHAFCGEQGAGEG